MPEYDPTPGSRLVRATVGFYASLRPGEVGEIPDEIAERAIRTGMAVPVDTLEARMKEMPSYAGMRRWVEIEEAVEDEAPVTDLPPVPRPLTSASKATWFEYAVSQDADPAVAEKLTKAELIEQYGQDADDRNRADEDAIAEALAAETGDGEEE